MGVDSSSIGIVVLNVLIFFAEMVTWTSLHEILKIPIESVLFSILLSYKVTSSMLGKDANSIADTRMLKASLFEWITKGHNDKASKYPHRQFLK
jgi:hypothetical protein